MQSIEANSPVTVVRKCLFWAGIVGCVWMLAAAQPAAASPDSVVRAWPLPASLVENTNITVTAGGVAVPVEFYERPQGDKLEPWFTGDPAVMKGLTVNIIRFTCSGPATLRIRFDHPIDNVVVRPLSRRIPIQTDVDSVSLDIPGPCNLIVEEGNRPPLLIFAEAPETDVPATNAPGVRYFGPGVHEPGMMTLANNETIYIHPEAVVYGGFSGGPTNARVMGRGILDGRRFEHRGFNSLTGATNVTVEGIIIRGAGSWHNTLRDSDYITYRGVKILTFCMNGDGIDVVTCRNVLIEDCFFRCSDDCISIKSRVDKPSHDITIRNCIMDGYGYADGVTVGYEMDAPSVERVRVSNCDILRARGGGATGGHSAFSVMCDGRATISDVLFENIRVEERVIRLCEVHITDGMQWAKDRPGTISNVRFKNIQWAVEKPIPLKGYGPSNLVDGVTFEDCTIAGRPLTELSHRMFQTNEYVRNVRIVSSTGITNPLFVLRSNETASPAALEALWAKSTEWTAAEKGYTCGKLKLAVVGTNLAVRAWVNHASTNTSGTLELFVSAVDSAIVRQAAITLDASEMKYFEMGKRIEGPSSELHVERLDNGYEATALIPLAFFNLPSDVKEIEFEAAIDAQPPAARNPMWVSLFGSVSAFRNDAVFGRMRVKEIE